MLSAREYQAEFWAELALKSPSLARLDTIGLSIEKAMSGADAGFKRLLQLNPNSVPVMRRYAQFLAEVTNNAGRAEQLSQQRTTWRRCSRRSLRIDRPRYRHLTTTYLAQQQSCTT